MRVIHPRCIFRPLNTARSVSAHQWALGTARPGGSLSGPIKMRRRAWSGEPWVGPVGSGARLASAARLGTSALRGHRRGDRLERWRALVSHPVAGHLPLQMDSVGNVVVPEDRIRVRHGERILYEELVEAWNWHSVRRETMN